jgi:hypothetical protein
MGAKNPVVVIDGNMREKLYVNKIAAGFLYVAAYNVITNKKGGYISPSSAKEK